MISTSYSSSLSSMNQAVNKLASQIADLQEQATTGLAVTKPSDAPEQIEQIHRLSSELADQETWTDNAGRATSYLDVAETALSAMSDLISRATELATQFSSETYTSEDRADAAAEAEAILSQLVGLANTEVGGRYIFAGTAYDSAAFDDDGNYLGSSDTPSTMVGSDQEVATGFDGSELLQGDVDIFATVSALADLLADTSNADAADDIAALLGDFSDCTDQLSGARYDVAVEFNKAEDAMQLAESMETTLATSLDDLTAADSVEVYTRLAELQTTYQAVLQIMGASSGTNLFSYI